MSPDGNRLAYVRSIDTGAQSPAPVLVIRGLATGDERELARDNEPDFHFIPETAWTADGEQVAFVAGEILTGLYVVDVDAASLDEAQRIAPVAREDGTSWSAVTAFGEDTLAVVETCCDVGDRQRWLVLAVNLSQQEVEGGLLPGDPGRGLTSRQSVRRAPTGLHHRPQAWWRDAAPVGWFRRARGGGGRDRRRRLVVPRRKLSRLPAGAELGSGPPSLRTHVIDGPTSNGRSSASRAAPGTLWRAPL